MNEQYAPLVPVVALVGGWIFVVRMGERKLWIGALTGLVVGLIVGGYSSYLVTTDQPGLAYFTLLPTAVFVLVFSLAGFVHGAVGGGLTSSILLASLIGSIAFYTLVFSLVAKRYYKIAFVIVAGCMVLGYIVFIGEGHIQFGG